MYRATKGLIETDLGEEMVLLNPLNSQMYSLNRTGRIVWQNLADPRRAEQELTRTYGLAPGQAEADIQRLLEQLLSRNLIEDV